MTIYKEKKRWLLMIFLKIPMLTKILEMIEKYLRMKGRN